MSNARSERRPRGELTRVLVVDDEADIRELIDLTLVRMGLAAECAGSVAEAKAALNAGSFQLCLTDMRLPDGDGLEIVRYIGEHHVQTPVAVITAFGSAENAVAALKALPGNDLQIVGSGNLIQSLQAASLIDEYIVWTFPVILGRGKRLFETTVTPQALRLVSTKASATGVVMSTYVSAGDIAVGSFAQGGPGD